MKSKIIQYQNRISELNRKIKVCQDYKERSIKYYYHISKQFEEWKISHEEHDKLLRETFHNKDIEYWVEYYDNKVKEYGKEIKNLELEVLAEKSTQISPLVMISLFIITLLLTLVIGLRFTGFTVYEPGQTINENITLDVNRFVLENSVIEVSFNNTDYNESINKFASNLIEVDNKTGYNLSSLVIDLSVFNIKVEDYGTYELIARLVEESTIIAENITEIIVNQTNIVFNVSEPINESKEIISEDNLIQDKIEINKPVKWIRKIVLNNPENNLVVNITSSANNISVKKVEGVNKIIIGDNKLKIKKLGDLIEISINENVKEIEIEYYTEPPKLISNNIDKYRKEILVSSDIHYENITVNSKVTESKIGFIRIYRTTDGIREPTAITNYKDTNNNGLVDYIEWVVPSLSNQTYLIEITKAEHLNESREFISNIYEEVKALDNIWSEIISSEHYVRVTFERNLTLDRDITIYPRVISGNPKIEVYEFNQTELIATFESLNSNEYNKVYLNNLTSESQDTFDLKIVNGEIEIEHIVDPTQGLYIESESCLPSNKCTVTSSSNLLGAPDGNQANAPTAAGGWAQNAITWTYTMENTSASGTFDYVNITFYNIRSGADVDDALVLEYQNGNGTWVILRCFESDTDNCGGSSFTYPTSNTNITFAAPIVTSLAEVNSTQIRMRGYAQDGGPNNWEMYIDSVLLNVTYTEVTDTTKPNFTLKSPVDRFNTSSSLVIFNQSVSDNTALSNVSLFGNWTGSYIRNQTNSTGLNNADYFFNITLNTNGNYIWAYEACDPSNNCNISNNFTFTFDNTGPSVTASSVNETSIDVDEYICINATATDTLLPISSAWVMTTSPSGTVTNTTMTDTGPYCSKNANDNIYGVNIQLTSSGSYYINKTYANDTLNNLGSETLNTQANATQNNVAPVILDISDLGSQTITEGGTKNIQFYTVINDNNGASTINVTNATFFRSGEELRSNLTCSRVSNLNTTAANFSCIVPIWFYDGPGTWDVNVTANDTSNLISSAFNETFTLSETTGMNATITSITFASASPDTFNVTSNNDPDTIQNTGNKNNTQIQVTAISLIGDTDNTTNIPAANFSVSIVTGSNLECYTTWSNQTTTLTNNTAVSIANATLLRSASATRSLYFCLRHIPLSATGQTYSTLGGGAWTIQVV